MVHFIRKKKQQPNNQTGKYTEDISGAFLESAAIPH